MKHKRGQVEQQFNWLFVLIAGAVILLFFVGIILRQKGASETKLCVTILDDLDLSFATSKEQAGMSSPVDLFDVGLDFSCDNFRCADIDGPERSLGRTILFAPKELRGDRLLTWALEWNIPFKVDNFLFVTAEENRYYILCNSALSNNCQRARNVYERIPDNFTKDFIDVRTEMPEIKDLNDNKVRFLLYNLGGTNEVENIIQQIIPKFERLEDEDVTFLVLDDLNAGFYSKHGSSFEDYGIVPLPEQEGASLYGALFTDDKDNFNCILEKAKQRVKWVADIYRRKASMFATQGVTDPLCGYYYDTAVNELTKLVNEGFSDFASVKSKLREINGDLQSKTCPLIY
ncbi:hypothetical protein KY330_00730 [Candidatus Woesearchaeota archaeon]|nr:hypothetical protein [Candidatus Woesearchaeota archaeon]